MRSLPSIPLPKGVRSRQVGNGRGLDMHVLEAGPDEAPLIVLLHGFPELAFSWRKVMPLLAKRGYRTLAPDQRGFGRTLGSSNEYDTDLTPFSTVSLAADILGLVDALGQRSVRAIVGHDFGASVAGTLALMHPDRFERLAIMSAPFAIGPTTPGTSKVADIAGPLAALPRPRKHYHAYYATRQANSDMLEAKQGISDFLRAYFHHKSADWHNNRPFPLAEWSAAALEVLPTYYIMDLKDTMPSAVASEMPTASQVEKCKWLPQTDLEFFSAEFTRTGFQGGLNWYRARLAGTRSTEDKELFERTVDIPASFIAGASDWGVRQTPGALERMKNYTCSDFRGTHLINSAGHWVQQEQPEAVVEHLMQLLN